MLCFLSSKFSFELIGRFWCAGMHASLSPACLLTVSFSDAAPGDGNKYGNKGAAGLDANTASVSAVQRSCQRAPGVSSAPSLPACDGACLVSCCAAGVFQATWRAASASSAPRSQLKLMTLHSALAI